MFVTFIHIPAYARGLMLCNITLHVYTIIYFNVDEHMDYFQFGTYIHVFL